MFKRLLPSLVAVFTIILVTGCGSTVTEPSGNEQDATLQDVVLSDVIRDTVVKDTEPSDAVQDVIKPDTQEQDAIVYPDGELEDTEPSSDTSADVVIEDAVSEDVVNSDSGTDASSSDTGIQYCKVGEEKLYNCPGGTTVTECVCEYKGCIPKCDKIGTKSEGWYDCEGNLIRFASCKDCKVECNAWGTRSEGWYSSDCDGLIKYDSCAPEWKCVEDPASLCKTYCKDSCDCPKDKPLCVNGICDSPILVGCNNNNNLCPCGQYCAGNICNPGTGQCFTSCDCKDAQTCVNGICKDKITNDCRNEPCPCNPVSYTHL
ncbi:MAG: hypothetical protein N3B13_02310, partial [Deltaproteobacteria bacterium]|nr:hypothetical protein [Deltaproteobacteria bacterium]